MARDQSDGQPKIRIATGRGQASKVAASARVDDVAREASPDAAKAPPATGTGEAAAIEVLKRLRDEKAAQIAAGELAGDGTVADRAADRRAATADAGDAPASDREAGLLELLRIEGEARSAGSPVELLTLIANAPRRLTRARQIFVVRQVAGRWHVVSVSALPAVDRTAPLVRFIEHTAHRLQADAPAAKPKDFQLSAYASPDDDTAAAYPMQEALWVPLLDRQNEVLAGILLTREVPWQERDIVVATRLGGAFQHALVALEGRRPLWRRARVGSRMRLALVFCVLVLGVVPVSLTTLAPAEIVARAPFVVAAPIEGVIEDIPVAPNARVEKGALLVKFDDTLMRNKFEIAEREVLVASARLKTTTQLAFADERGRHDMAVARADLILKTVERDFAREMLAKTEIRATRAGLAVFADKKELIGKPMTVGERILEIADPADVELRIDVPVDDAIILRNGARVKVLLDADPLSAIEARIVHSDYQARPSDANVLSFRATAELIDKARHPRLGGRGSAQIYGDRVPLAFYLLRRPFAKLRQWTGL